MEKITAEYLLELYEKKNCYGCVALFRRKNTVYFAVNGNPSVEAVGINAVQCVFGKNSIPCKYDHSFTVLKPYVTQDLIREGKIFCETLDLFPGYRKIPFQLIKGKLFAKNVGLSNYNGRYFSCAEKKIIGYLEQNGIPYRKLVTTAPPCYHCLPVIKQVDYLSSDYKSKKKISRKNMPHVSGQITYYYFKHR